MSYKTRTIPVLVAVAAVVAVGTRAQQVGRVPALDDQIERIVQAREYAVPRFGPARWLPDGTAYAIVERPDKSAEESEIVRYDAVTGARRVVVAASRLVPAGAEAPLDIDDYMWSADGKRLLIFTNTKKVWRQNTRGDYCCSTLTAAP